MFERVEYITRLNKTKQAMQDKEMDILVSTNPANMNYLSGYDGYSFYVAQGVIVFMDEEEPVWIGRQMDFPGAEFTTWLKQKNLLAYNDDYVQSDSKHPMHFFAEILKSKGAGKKTIGLEMGQASLDALSYYELQKKLPDCRFADASFLVNWVRMIKSEKEIAYMKLAGKITANAMQTAVNTISEGVQESAAAAEVYQALIAGVDGYAGDYPAIIPLMSAGQQISAPHLSWSNRHYKKEEIVTLELSGCVNRYHAPLARTLYLGNPPGNYRETAKIVLEGLAEMLSTIKPGATCHEVAESWNRHIAKAGIRKDSRAGYPIGLGYPPDWGEQTASIRAGDQTVLQENMTFHILPALFEKDSGFVVSEAVHITSNGYELIADFSNELVIR